MKAVRILSSFRLAGARLSTLAIAAFPMPPALPPGGSYAPLAEAMHIQGQPVSAWVFDAPGTLPDIASWLTAHQPALRDMWVMPGAVVLAGISGGMHWAARLFEADGRTRGTISALPMAEGAGVGISPASPSFAGHPPVRLASRPDKAATNTAWALKGGQLRFEIRTRDEDATVIEQIWTHDLGPTNLGKRLAVELEAEGWRPAAPVDPIAAQAGNHWTRGRTSLSTVIVPLDNGSGVTAVMRIEG